MEDKQNSIDSVPNGSIKKKSSGKEQNFIPKPRTSFIWFCNTYRTSVQLRYPNIPSSDVQKILGLMWRDTPPEKKDVFKSLAEQERMKLNQQRGFLHQKSEQTPNFVTPAMKKQSFDFNFPPELIQIPEIPSLDRIGLDDPEWKVNIDNLVVEDLGFDHLCHDEEGQEIELEHESTNSSHEKMKYFEVHVVKTPEMLKNNEYDLVISKELPEKLFDSPDKDEDGEETDIQDEIEELEPPVLEKYLNEDLSRTYSDDMEMPILEKEN